MATARITFAPTLQKPGGDAVHEQIFFRGFERILWPNSTDRINQVTVVAGDEIEHHFNWLHVRDVEIDNVGQTRVAMKM